MVLWQLKLGEGEVRAAVFGVVLLEIAGGFCGRLVHELLPGNLWLDSFVGEGFWRGGEVQVSEVGSGHGGEDGKLKRAGKK